MLPNLKYLIYFSFLSTLAFTAVKAQAHESTLFYFVPSLGSCGHTNTDSDIVASVSRAFFDSYPGATANPNANPLCFKSVFVTHGSNSVTAVIVDTFAAGGRYDIGLSIGGFLKLGNLNEGRIPNVTWTVV